MCVCDRCWRTCRPHRPLYHHPPQEHQCNHGEKRGHHGVCCQCKVNFSADTRGCWGKDKCKYTQADMHTLSKHLHLLLSPPHLIFCDLNESWNLLFEHDRKVFCTSLILYLSSILPFDSRLHSVLPISRNPSPEFWLLSSIQRLNQNDRCIPLLPQCSVTLKQNMNLY